MRLTTRSKYGTRLMLDIALNGDEGPVRAGDIAARQRISKKYLEKLLRILKEGGLVTSKPGPGGGYMLKLPAEMVKIGDLVQLLDGGSTSQECAVDVADCPRFAVCLSRSMWQEAWRAVCRALNTYTLADLVRDADLCPLGLEARSLPPLGEEV